MQQLLFHQEWKLATAISVFIYGESSF